MPCSNEVEGRCKLYPEFNALKRYGMTGCGFLPGITILLFSGLIPAAKVGLAYEPMLYPILITVGVLCFVFFTYVVGQKKRFEELDYFKTSAAYGTAVVAFLSGVIS